jgi:kynurenine formamidase
VKVIDLSMTIYEGCPVGSVWPYDTPFTIEEIWSHEKHGFRSFKMTLSQEGAGTRFMVESTFLEAKDGLKVDQVDLSKLVLRDAVVLDTPKEAEGEIMADDIDHALANANYRPGDAVIVRTGWGDNERYRRIGTDYVIKAPHWTRPASEKITSFMKANGSDLLIYDSERFADLVGTKAYGGWAQRKPLPKPWPSPEALEVTNNFVRDDTLLECSSYLPFVRNRIMVVGAAVNCGAISQKRVKVIVLPLKVEGACGVPCRVVALEED